jgi:Flp pilus assembly protein CpaB
MRTIVLLVLSIVCGLAASYMTAQYLRPHNVTVLVAAKPIPRSASIADYQNFFTPTEFPGNTSLPANCLTSYEQVRERARDGVLRQAMNQGEPLSADYIVDRRQSISTLLRPGYNAIGVRATPESSLFGLLEPESYVKVLAVRKLAGGEKKIVILMKNVRVLAVDRQLESAAATREKSGVPNIISLEVTDEESKILKSAQEEAPLTLAVMSQGNDHDRKGEEEPPAAVKAPEAPAVKPVLRNVVVARGPLPRGTALRDLAVQFTVREVPQERLPDNAVTSLDEITGKIEGMIVVKGMKEGEPLSTDYFMAVTTPIERERLLTIIEANRRRVYAQKADGRMRLIESVPMVDEGKEPMEK